MNTGHLIIRFIVYFNIFTLLMYIISPFSIQSDYHMVNIIYIGLNILLMKKGLDSGLKRAPNYAHIFKKPQSLRIFYCLLIFYLLTFTLRYAYSLYLPPFDLNALINRISIGIADPQLGRHLLYGTRLLPWTLYCLFSVFDSVFLIYALMKWKQLTIPLKIVIVSLFIFEALFSMGSGTNFGVIMLCSSIFLAIMIQIPKSRISKAKLIKFLVIGVAFLVIVLSVFMYNMEGRSGGNFESIEGYDFLAVGSSVKIAPGSYIEYLPYRFQIFLLLIFSYLTQGYLFMENIYGLDFHWGGFFGNNPGAQSMAKDFLGFDPEINAYQTQMIEYGVDPYINWHSGYTWLANDFTIFLVPIAIFYIAKFTSTAMVLYRRNYDICSGIIFIVLSNMLLFLFANNNYISSVFYSLLFLLPYWFFFKYRRING